MYVYKSKSTNYIWCFVSVFQIAKKWGEYSTSISKMESYLYYKNGTSILCYTDLDIVHVTSVE